MYHLCQTIINYVSDVLSVIKAIIPPQIFYGDVQLEVDSSLLTTQSLELVFLNNSIHQKLVTPRSCFKQEICVPELLHTQVPSCASSDPPVQNAV